MSNRFHNKFHRENHHSKRTPNNNSIADASYDPIASYSAPFQGEFCTDGEIVTNSYLQAASGTFVDLISSSRAVFGVAPLSATLNVQNSYLQTSNLNGDYVIRTQDGMGRVNHYWNTMGGTSPTFNKSNEGARKILFGGNTQSMLEVGASFPYTNSLTAAAGDPITWQTAFIITKDGKVGIGTTAPNNEFTVVGSISAVGNLNIGTLSTGTTNSVITENAGELQKRTINTGVWNTATVLVGSNATLDIGYIQKAISTTEISKSIIYEDAANNRIGVGTTSPIGKLHVEGNIWQYNPVGNNEMTVEVGDSSNSYTRYYNTAGFTDIGQSLTGTYIDTNGQDFSILNGAVKRISIANSGLTEINSDVTINASNTTINSQVSCTQTIYASAINCLDGVILKAPDNSKWRIVVTNTGTLSTISA
jgi:hypothetical protein